MESRCLVRKPVEEPLTGLEVVGYNALDGVLEIVPEQWRDGIIALAAPESPAHGRFANRFQIRRRKSGEPLGQPLDLEVQLAAFQILAQEALAVGLAGRANLDLLRESPAAEDRRIDPIQMVRGSNQENVVLRL